MKTLFFLLAILTASTSTLLAQPAESVTIATYYPAPFGKYQLMQIAPSASLSPAECDLSPGNAAEGMMRYYVGDATNPPGLYVCTADRFNNLTWTPAAGTGSTKGY